MLRLPNNAIATVDEVVELLRRGVPLAIAGEEEALDKLPPGRWIGGTTSYAMGTEGGVELNGRLFITIMTEGWPTEVKYYRPDELQKVIAEAPENGFTCAILPAGSLALQRFAEESRYWSEMALKPVVGWVSGVRVVEIGRRTPRIYNGNTGEKFEDGLIAAHVTLPADRIAWLEMINIFEPDERFSLSFPKTGFEQDACLVNGEPMRLADFFRANGNSHGRLPLIGDFSGAGINASVQSIDLVTGNVVLYAPVFPDVEYHLAKPVEDYEKRFSELLTRRTAGEPKFSCNCVLNYLYGGLEGRKIGSHVGPVSFGEIAYLLHNQTMVMLTVD